MRVFDRKVLAIPLSVVLLASTPFAARAAESSSQGLCAAAAADPQGFILRADFKATLPGLTATCPGVAQMLQRLEAARVLALSKGDGAANLPAVADNSALLDELATALESLRSATAEVNAAQMTLAKATVHLATVRSLRAAVLEDADVDRKILADYTQDVFAALAEYNSAKDNLVAKQAVLSGAKAAAEDRFGFGNAKDAFDAAQADLDGVLGGQTFYAMIDAYQLALSNANSMKIAKGLESGQLADEIVVLQNKFDAMPPRAVLQEAYDTASRQVDTAQDAARAAQDLSNSTRDAWLALRDQYNSCAPGCTDVQAQMDQAFVDYVAADALASSKNRAFTQARNDADAAYQPLADYLSTSSAIIAKMDAKAAADAAVLEAEADATQAQSNIDTLADLQDAYDTASDTLQTAQDNVSLATSAEGMAVAVATKRLADATANALGVVKGSLGEEEAEEAIRSARADLKAALMAQKIALYEAAAATSAARGNGDPEVVAAVDAIGEAAESGIGAAQGAAYLDGLAEATLTEHQDARDALEDTLLDDGVIKPPKPCACQMPVAVPLSAAPAAEPAQVAASDEQSDAADDPAPESGPSAGADVTASDAASDAPSDAGGESGDASGSDTGGAGADASASETVALLEDAGA